VLSRPSSRSPLNVCRSTTAPPLRWFEAVASRRGSILGFVRRCRPLRRRFRPEWIGPEWSRRSIRWPIVRSGWTPVRPVGFGRYPLGLEWFAYRRWQQRPVSFRIVAFGTVTYGFGRYPLGLEWFAYRRWQQRPVSFGIVAFGIVAHGPVAFGSVSFGIVAFGFGRVRLRRPQHGAPVRVIAWRRRPVDRRSQRRFAHGWATLWCRSARRPRP
jgi:hypothetical protein